MAMLAKCAGMLRGGDRYEELVYLGCPADLAKLCVRPMVWSRQWANHLYAYREGQERTAIPELDWIEYIPDTCESILQRWEQGDRCARCAELFVYCECV